MRLGTGRWGKGVNPWSSVPQHQGPSPNLGPCAAGPTLGLLRSLLACCPLWLPGKGRTSVHTQLPLPSRDCEPEARVQREASRAQPQPAGVLGLWEGCVRKASVWCSPAPSATLWLCTPAHKACSYSTEPTSLSPQFQAILRPGLLAQCPGALAPQTRVPVLSLPLLAPWPGPSLHCLH